MSRSTLKAALIQDINHGDADANLSVIEQRVAEAAAAGADDWANPDGAVRAAATNK